ncbi:hypothetical protein BD414DRAFT_578858 [Trametes punicea]|nr:hypothetical protein BD414DRAFT_578858 [Trametes punicea]
MSSSVVFAPDVQAPTQSAGHLPHINPTAGPTQLSKTHPNIVNYAISAGGVLLGLMLIGAFALFLRCNKRRKKRALDAEIDARIHEKTLARMAASRTQSVAKLPSAALSRDQSVVHPMPLLTAARSSTANSSTETLSPRARATCIRASDQRLSCGCPDCVVLTRAASLSARAGSPGSGALTRATFGARGTLVNPHPTVRYTYASSRFPRSSSSARSSAGSRAVHVGPHRGLRSPSAAANSPTARLRVSGNDENAYRTNSAPTEPARSISSAHVEWAASLAAASQSGLPLSYNRGVGMGIITATSTGTLGCASPVTPSLVFSTPRVIGSAFGSPALSLSDDTGATTISPCTPPQVSLGSLGTLGSLARAGGSFVRSGTASSFGTTGKKDAGSSLNLALSRGHLGSIADSDTKDLAHVHVSPHVGVQMENASSHVSAQPAWASSEEQVIAGSTTAMGKRPQGGTDATQGPGQREKWFTEVDWFADDGPLAGLAYYDQPSSACASGYGDSYTSRAGIEV